MRTSGGLKLLTCLMVYVTQVHSIMVKYGTREGPILPPEPTEAPPNLRKQGLFVPAAAPVWEARNDDIPDPNAKWQPPLFEPYQPRYTKVVLLPSVAPPRDVQSLEHSLTLAQRIASMYKPKTAHNFILSSQNVPGLGIAYFMPAYIEFLREDKKPREEERNENSIDEHERSTAESQQKDIYHWHVRGEKKIHKNIFKQYIGLGVCLPFHLIESDDVYEDVTRISYGKKNTPLEPYKYEYVPPPYVESKQFRRSNDYWN